MARETKTDITPYHGNYWAYVAAFVSALVLFGVTALLVHKQRAFGWEVSIFRWVNNWQDSGYRVGQIFTLLGTTWAALAAVLIAFILRYYRLAWRLALSVCGASAVALLAKHFIGRARPLELLTHVHIRTIETGMGFPSAHVTIITVIMLTLWPYFSWKWRWIAPALILFVGFSRMYLGVHLPLDLIGGFAIGLGTVCFVRILPQPLRVLLRID